MLELKGKHNVAKVFTNNIESQAISQIIELCNQEFVKDSSIAIMPDVHAGAGCTIGTTMTIKDKVVPYLVGVDIGCGMYCIKLKNKNIDLEKLDNIINEFIPSGFKIRDTEYHQAKNLNLEENLYCKDHVNVDRAKKSLGTLGGGNHFIELNKDDEENFYLVIHTGSRNLGKQVADYYQNLALKALNDNRKEKEELINKLKSEGRESEIQDKLKEMQLSKVPIHLAYLEKENLMKYLHDINIVQKYAELNRVVIASIICYHAGLVPDESFHTIHNYIDLNNNILRKGAISANDGEKVIIPMNMRDGSIIAVGKGNPEWNCSAPHGAGRILSRRKAKELISLDDFKETMKDIYSTSVKVSTLDESPFAYKPMDEIIENIKDTVEIKKIIKPVYNFKATE